MEGFTSYGVENGLGEKQDKYPSFDQLKVILDKLSQHEHAALFNKPVDSNAYPDYYKIITKPMDLGTIRKNLEQSKYYTSEEVVRDIQLVWRNAFKYNNKNSDAHKYAKELSKEFDSMMKSFSEPKKVFILTKTGTKPTSPHASTASPDSNFSLQTFFKTHAPPSNTISPSLINPFQQQQPTPSPFGVDPKELFQSPSPERSKSDVSTPLSSKNFDVLQSKFRSICEILESHTDISGRYLSELFQELPSRDLYPDYYRVIKNPICIDDIKAKTYPNVKQFIKDWQTLFKNAHTYNEKDSQIYKDSTELQILFYQNIAQKFPDDYATLTLPRNIRSAVSSRLQDLHQNGEVAPNTLFDTDENASDSGSLKRSLEDDGDYDAARRSKRLKAVYNDKDKDFYYEGPEEEEEEEEDEEDDEDSGTRKSESFTTERMNPPKDVIEKIYADRIKKGTEKSDSEETQPEIEYFVKWKGKSHIHCEWVPGSRFGKSDPVNRGKINRYNLQKQRQTSADIFKENQEESYYPEEYEQVDRILASRQEEVDGKIVTTYLVKWKGLSYEEATWELPETFKDDQKIEDYKRYNKIPPIEKSPPVPIDKKKIFELLKEAPVFKDGNQLRPYQVEGMGWLAFCWSERRGCILADEMGLGKTVQSIAFLDWISKLDKSRGPYLVVAPLSTIGHWCREFEEWTDFNVVVYQGNKANRELTRQYDFFFLNDQGEPATKSIYKFNVLLTTYEMILSPDWVEIQQIPWKVLITDEAQRLKNQYSKLLGHLKQFKTEHRVLLTGTPLQNNTQELWTLLNFIEEKKFPSSQEFMAKYGQLQNSEQVASLHEVLRPHLLRRMKEDVEKSIPPKEETLVEVDLTSIQKQYYRAILEKNRDFLNKGCSGKNVPHLLNVFMQLRKVCNHPFLIPGVEEKETAGKQSPEEYLKAFVHSSAKMILLDKLLPKLKESGHKVLIFSQMMKVLDLLETYCKYRGYLYERLDGGIRGNERQASIDRFCKPNSDRFLFLLCTRAGGIGINLAAADTVIIYDSDWNPQNDIQAQARCHRIGQTQEVKVYRLITAKTYERHMFEKSSRKLGLDQAVLHDMGSPVTGESGAVTGHTPSRSRLEKKEIEELLKRGAYDLFNTPDNNYVEEDIDQILNRSSKVVWNEANAKVLGPSSSFSTATFQSSKDNDEIDIDDPDFWEKILPEARTAEKLLAKLDKPDALDTPEKRTEFMKDLEVLVEDVVENFTSNRVEAVSQTKAVLMKIFDVLRASITEFSPKDRNQISQWYEELNTRRRKSRFGSGRIDDRKLKFQRKFGELGWTEQERKNFHNAFMCYGPNRWKDIQRKGDLGQKDIDELKEYAQELIKQCLIQADESDRSIFLETLELLNDNLEDELALEVNPDFTKLIKRKLKIWAKQLKLISKLNDVIAASGGDIQEVEIPKVNKPLTSWWTYACDRSLILGVYRHGLGNYEDIKNDPTLSFYAHREEMAQAEQQEKEKKKEEGHEDKMEKDEKKEEVEEKKEGEVKTEPMDDATEEKDEMEVETAPSAAQLPATSPVLKISKLQLKIRLPAGWPASKILDGHVKYLVDTMRKGVAVPEKEKTTKHLLRLFEKEPKKTRAREERLKEWTKREMNDFRMALMQYGAGQWHVIREKASLHKSITQIEQYFSSLMKLCRYLVDNQHPGAKKSGQDEEDDDGDSQDESTPSKKKPTPKKKNAKQPQALDIQLDDGPNAAKSSMVTASMAKKLLKRIKLMDDIRNGILKHPEYEQRIAKVKSLDMPSWWKCPAHDKLLLESVAQYGIGTKEWDDYLESPECPFFRGDEDKKPEWRKQKEKFMKAFVKEKPPLLQRLEYLRLVVLDPAACVDLSRFRDRRRGVEYPSLIYTRSASGRGEGEDLPALELGPKVKLNLNFKPTRDVPRDEEGNPILPFTAKGATILSLGTVVYDRPGYHSKNYIWPVGFKSQRKLASTKNNKEHVIYTSEILDGGAAPLFQVTPSDNPKLVVKHNTSSGVWCEMLKLIKKRANVSVSGPEMYGFSDPTVKMLIQELPNARKCTNYAWKDFDAPLGIPEYPEFPDSEKSSVPSSPGVSSLFSPKAEDTKSVKSERSNASDLMEIENGER